MNMPNNTPNEQYLFDKEDNFFLLFISVWLSIILFKSTDDCISNFGFDILMLILTVSLVWNLCMFISQLRARIRNKAWSRLLMWFTLGLFILTLFGHLGLAFLGYCLGKDIILVMFLCVVWIISELIIKKIFY